MYYLFKIMKNQNYFKYFFLKKNKDFNLYTNITNIDAFKGVNNYKNDLIYLVGPTKSGKSSIAKIWQNKNNAVLYNNNISTILENKKNILIDDINKSSDQKKIFHLVNHAMLFKLKLLVTSKFEINELNFSLKDLNSRLKIFEYFKILNPDDDMLVQLLTKQLIKKQFIINSNEIFNYILRRVDRSYQGIYDIVNKLEDLSLEKKRQLTIPLIKEIL